MGNQPTYSMCMRPIQVMVEEDLLARLDRDEEVQKSGRSAVIRRAIADYLRRRRSSRISEAYRKAYSKGGTLGEELDGWTEEGSWPEP